MSCLALAPFFPSVALADPVGGLSGSSPSTGSSNGDSPTKDALAEEFRLLKEETVSIAVGLGREQPISQAPSNVYVITDEDIRNSGSADLPTILRRIPGIDVMQVSGAEFNVSTRGNNQLPANKLLVLIDGRSVYEDAYGSVYWSNLPIALHEIKRIEVLKGPASALYGFNAFDGVINIITKSPEEMKGTTLQFGVGELGTIRAAATQAGTHDKLGYKLTLGHDQNQQWRNRDALALRQNKVNLYTNYALSSESSLTLSGGFLGANSYDGQLYETIRETTTGISAWYANVAYERRNFFIRGWWNQWNLDSLEGTYPTISRYFSIQDRAGNPNQDRNRHTYNVEAQHTIELWNTHRFSYGFNLRHNTFSTNFLLGDFAREDRLGFYIQDEWRILDKLTATAGLRYDLHSEINPTFSPRISFTYSLSQDHTLRAAGSVAYRPPTLYEGFIDARGRVFPAGCPPVCAVSFGTSLIGSRNLQPEQMISYELEYQGWYLKHRLRARASLFYNQISELISFTVPSPTNQNKAEIYGGEAGIEYLMTSWLSGFANMTYQDIGANASTGTTPRGAPRFKYNAGLRGEWTNGLNSEVSLNYVGAARYPLATFFTSAANFPGGQPPPDTRVGSYVLLNIRAGYQFWHNRAECAISAFNALNDKHQEHPLGDVIGSRVMGWFTLKL